MKAKFILSFVTAFFLNVIFFSCTKDELIPDLKGSLVGYVFTFDEYANRLYDQSNVQVTALGLDHFSIRTDKNGRFEFKDLPAGTYELHVEKEGFGTMKQFGVQHLGGEPTLLGQTQDNYMSAFFIYQKSTSEITSLSIENDSLIAVIDFHGYNPGYCLMNIYFSVTGNFESKDAEYTTSTVLYASQNIYKGSIEGLENRFESRQNLFFKSCFYFLSGVIHDGGLSILPINYYFDYSLNQTIEPYLSNESSEYPYIMP
jgi:hypothetical protein